MKIRHLPEIDLARVAPMPFTQKERELERMKTGYPTFSYAPTRRRISDIFHVEDGFLVSSARTEWKTIAYCIAREAKSEEECLANLRAAEALYKLSAELNFKGRSQDFTPLTVGMSQKLNFWHPAVISFEHKPLIVFIDPRISSTKLSADGRRFVFSAMHERIRISDPDYSRAELGIIQFRKLMDGSRSASLCRVEDSNLFSFAELDGMVRETYDLWEKIQIRRSEETRRKGTGTTGPLFE